MDLSELSEKIKTTRKAKKLTQEELSKRVGLSRYTIIQLESGNISDLGIRKVLNILNHLGLEMTVGPWKPKAFPTLEDMYEINRQERQALRDATLRAK